MKTLVGKTILVGVTVVDQDEKVIRQEQFFGVIKTVSDEDGIVVETEERGPVRFPPDVDAVSFAPRGVYTCLCNNKQVTNPDFMAAWGIMRPPEDEGGQSMWRPFFAPFYMNDFMRHIPRQWEFELGYDRSYVEGLIETRSNEYVGKTVLVGLRHYVRRGEEEELVKQEQLHGTIISVNMRDGITVKLDGGDELKLPPDLSFLQRAGPGEFRLRESGRVITNPDYMTMFAITKPAE